MSSAPVPTWRTRPPLRVGTVVVQPASNELVVDGTIVRVKPRLMDVLLRLAAAPGEVVTRDALLADAWPRRMVNDEVLSRAIADLRLALRDDAREPRFIETLPKVGYRLLAPVTPVADEEAPSPEATGTPGAGVGATMPATPAAPVLRWRHLRASRALATAVVAAVVALALTLHGGVPDSPEPAGHVARLVAQLAHAEPFSSSPDLEVGPRFSPDGSQVAFAAGRGARSQIVVRDVRADTRVTVGAADETSLAPVFFPGGQRLAFFRATPDGSCEIVAHELATGARERLVDCTREPRVRFDLAPDGSALVYTGVVRPGFPAGLVQRTLATGAERVLTTPAPDEGDDVVPRYSPDGTRIAFFRGTQSHRQLWLVDAQGGVPARNVNGPRGLSYGAAWLDGATLLVAADWFGQRTLNMLDPATGRAQSVGARGARFPDVDRAGNIVFENAVYSANLFEVDVADPTRAPRELWPSTRYSNQPEYAPDGTRIVFVSNRDGAAGLYVAAPGSEPVRLAVTDDHVYMRPHWSDDGREIYAVRVGRREDGGRVQQAVRIDVATRRLEVLAALGDNVFDLRPAGDGRHWLVGEIADNAARLLLHGSLEATGQRLPLPIAAEYQVAGGRIALLQPALEGLTLCELATTRCEQVALPIGDANRFDWQLARDAIWYRTAGTRDLVRFDLGQRNITFTSAHGPTAAGTSIAVAPDGRRAIVAREAPLAIDLMLAPRGRK